MMKIDLAKVDRESFMVHESIAYGEPLYLIQPQHIGCKWTQENKIFRSSIWNKEGELVSAGFPKFPNWGEQPEVFPLPKSLKDCACVDKLDGSLLIVSSYKGKLILRTRGTFDARGHENGYELELFLSQYKEFLNTLVFGNEGYRSYLFEWVSPKQRIILNYGDTPRFFLVGAVDHRDYSLVCQELLDDLADMWKLLRPPTQSFNSVENLLELVENWKGKEGIVVYSKNGQVLHKVKSAWYLALHRMKSEISNIENLVDVFLTWGMPEYQSFETRLIETFDFELFNQIRGDVSRICGSKKNADQIVAHMQSLVPQFKTMSRKDAALDIMAKYGQTTKKAIMFNLLDGKSLDNKAWKTLLLQGI